MQLLERFQAGDRRALARAITWVENGLPEAAELVKATFPLSGRAHIVGVTGPPGAGKSTLVDRMAAWFRRSGKSVGIVAVDPTSPFSGGAILGDRIRMQRTLADPGVFMRSLATRGHLGGLSLATGDVVGLMDAFGFEVVIVETVGAGQSEVEIMGLAHTTCVILIPGAGDDIQAIKAGILEIGDIFAVNKADREGADRAVTEVEMMLDLGHMGNPGINRWADGMVPAARGMHRLDPAGHHSLSEQEEAAGWVSRALKHAATRHGTANTGDISWRPPVVKTVARDDRGTEDLVSLTLEHHAFLQETGRLQAHRLEDAAAKIREIISIRAARTLMTRSQEELDGLVRRVAAREIDPYTAAETVLRKHLSQ